MQQTAPTLLRLQARSALRSSFSHPSVWQACAAKAVNDILDPKGLEALHRLHQRAQHASCDWQLLLWWQGAAALEDCIKQSFAAGMSLNLEQAKVKH